MSSEPYPESYNFENATWHERTRGIFTGCPVGDYHGQSEEILSMLKEYENMQALKAAKLALQTHCTTEQGPVNLDEFEKTHTQIELSTN